jgi:hypothetical protein
MRKLKSLLKFIFAFILGLFLSAVLLLAAFEAYVWSMHDFKPYYADIQDCIETGGVWDEAERICKK